MQQHRLDDPDEPLIPINFEREREWLCNLERAWRDGSLLALSVAVFSCAKNHRPLPKGANDALLALLAMPEKKRRGRLSSLRKKDQQNEIHFVRHLLVQQLKPAWASKTVRKSKPEMIWDDAYEEASRLLRGTTAQGSGPAIKRSYGLVERQIKQGAGWKFYVC